MCAAVSVSKGESQRERDTLADNDDSSGACVCVCVCVCKITEPPKNKQQGERKRWSTFFFSGFLLRMWCAKRSV